MVGHKFKKASQDIEKIISQAKHIHQTKLDLFKLYGEDDVK